MTLRNWSLLITAIGLTAATLPAFADPATDPAFRRHRLFKQISYSSITAQTAEKIRAGQEQPLLPFIVKGTPASIFLNFEIRPDRLAAYTQHLKLPPGFQLVPVAIIDGETPRHFLSLNIYEVSGLGGALAGFRAEWSAYVSYKGGRPSFMVVEARNSNFSLDPVNWFTRGTPLTHTDDANGIRSVVASDNGRVFESTIAPAGRAAATPVFASPRWAACNDRIYWPNGVADRVYYDGLLVDTPLLSIPLNHVTLRDTTIWRDFIHPQPVHVLVFQTALEFVITPWFNVN